MNVNSFSFCLLHGKQQKGCEGKRGVSYGGLYQEGQRSFQYSSPVVQSSPLIHNTRIVTASTGLLYGSG